MKALVYWPSAPARVIEYLVESLNRITGVETARDLDDAMLKVRGSEIFVGQLSNKILEEARKLRFAQVTSAGVDHLDLEMAKSRGILLASAKGANSFYVAELALALILALAKRVVDMDRSAKSGVFPEYSWGIGSLSTLRGKTVVIYGYGGIGRELARLLKPLGAKIIGVRRSVKESFDDGHAVVVGPGQSWEYLARADFLVVAVHLTKETRRLVNRDFLSRLKRGSYLINVSRGEVVDEDALYDALSNGRLAGAGIDTWWLYPEDDRGRGTAYSSRGIHKLPNVVAIPHRGGFVEEAFMDVAKLAVRNVERFLKGEPVEGLVDYEKGY